MLYIRFFFYFVFLGVPVILFAILSGIMKKEHEETKRKIWEY